jgi:hypothetical protein
LYFYLFIFFFLRYFSKTMTKTKKNQDYVEVFLYVIEIFYCA